MPLSPGPQQYTGSSSTSQQHWHGPGLHLAQRSHFQMLPTALLGAAPLPPLPLQWDGAVSPCPPSAGMAWRKPGKMAMLLGHLDQPAR